jgi:hypothetical protein
MKFIVPLTKSPAPSRGRIGPTKWQDWYRGLVLTAKLVKKNPDSKILIISDFKVPNCRTDAVIYTQALLKLGVPSGRIKIIRREFETCGQIEVALDIAKENEVVFISSLLHSPRVLWLTFGIQNCQRKTIFFGIPRPDEALTDIVLAGLFPLIDLCRLRKWFLTKVTNRRATGKR